MRPRAKSGARRLGPAVPEDIPHVIPIITKPRKKPNIMQIPAATAAAIGKDLKTETTTRPASKPPVEKSKRVTSVEPQGNRKPVARKASIDPNVKVAAGMPGAKGVRKPRNKKALLMEVEQLKGM